MAVNRKTNKEDFWAPFEERLARENGRILAPKTNRRYKWVVPAIIPIALTLGVTMGVMLPLSLSTVGRISIWIFSLAVILWSTTKLNVAYVALLALVFLVTTKRIPQEYLYQSLASDVIWLMIGAFVLGGAIKSSGLGNRLTHLVFKRNRRVSGIFWLLTVILIPLTFLIPSTTGRAAVVMPLFNSITQAADEKKITRALSLLLSAVILVVTIVTLNGAGSHLIANNLLVQQTGKSITFLQWMIYAMPFGILAAILTCWVVLRMFLTKPLRQKIITVQLSGKKVPYSAAEKKTMIVALLMVLMWMTESFHGIEIAVVAVAGAVALTFPGFGVLSWKEGLNSVSWDLIIFIGAALMLGKSLIDSGASGWIIGQLFTFTGLNTARTTLLLLIILSFLSLTSHIYITSHTARAAALVPGFLYLAQSLHLNPVAVLFIATVGMDYCLTFPVSSKAILMFEESDEDAFQPADLLRLSAVMLIIHFLLMLLFYFTYWRWVGLQLHHF